MSEELPDLGRRVALRPDEVARALGIGKRTVRDILSRLPHFRIGTAVLIPVDCLKEWVRDQVEVPDKNSSHEIDEIVNSLEYPKRDD